MRTPGSGQEVSRKSAVGRGGHAGTVGLWMRQGESLACTYCGRNHSHRTSLGSAEFQFVTSSSEAPSLGWDSLCTAELPVPGSAVKLAEDSV